LAEAINAAQFNVPTCPVYQNVVAKAVTDAAAIKANLIEQLTGAVRWTQSVQSMIADGATAIYRSRPGKSITGIGAKNK
jgi:[acyl-carrier-protein] S-malonyltransferase